MLRLKIQQLTGQKAFSSSLDGGKVKDDDDEDDVGRKAAVPPC